MHLECVLLSYQVHWLICYQRFDLPHLHVQEFSQTLLGQQEFWICVCSSYAQIVHVVDLEDGCTIFGTGVECWVTFSSLELVPACDHFLGDYVFDFFSR